MSTLHIDADFPGGNIIVDRIQNDVIDLHQDLRDTDRDWFYWYFRLRGAAGRTLRFNFTASRAIGTRGPAMSRDGGRTWNWLGTDCVEANSFAHRLADQDDDVRFSFGMPYQLADWQRFAAARPWLRQEVLTQTRGGRDVPLVRMGDGPVPVFISARHHCCEMMPSYAIEGLIDYCRDDREPEANWLRQQATITIVPIVDLDGVEAGDQGKGRRPRDHNRDYVGTSIYPEVAAVRGLLESVQPTVMLDLHCPWIAGPHNELIYVVGNASAEIAAEQRRFSQVLEDARRGPLPFFAAGYLPYGVAWNTSANSTDGRSIGSFAATLAGAHLVGTIELPYATAEGAEVNQATARQFGPDLARAIARYLQSST